MKHSGTIKNENMAYFSLNTSFINTKNPTTLDLKELSPYATFKNGKFPRDF